MFFIFNNTRNIKSSRIFPNSDGMEENISDDFLVFSIFLKPSWYSSSIDLFAWSILQKLFLFMYSLITYGNTLINIWSLKISIILWFILSSKDILFTKIYFNVGIVTVS